MKYPRILSIQMSLHLATIMVELFSPAQKVVSFGTEKRNVLQMPYSSVNI